MVLLIELLQRVDDRVEARYGLLEMVGLLVQLEQAFVRVDHLDVP